MPQPNILLIHCHDLGRHLHCYGASSVSSPNLDAFAAEGVLAEQMFCTAPQCSPSRAGLFTGRWPHANGVLGLTHSHFAWDLHPGERHLADLLRSAGYATELQGVHHESRRQHDEQIADRLGFDRVQTGGLVDVVAERGVQAIDRLARGDRPFYLQLGFVEPHRLRGSGDPDGVHGFVGDHLRPDDRNGVEVPPYLLDTPQAREEIAELQGAITAMDAGVGRLLDALDAVGAAENTITIFTTDHGLALPRAKCSLYDPGIEIAFLIRWPAGGWTGGTRLTEPLINIDVLPTLLDALQLQADGEPVHGRSFAPLLPGGSGEVVEREVIFGEMTYHDYYDPRRSARTERHKLIVNFSSAPEFMDPSQSWVRRCRAEAISSGLVGYHPTVELYDLAADPYELDDVADDSAYADVRASLLGELGRWMTETGDPLLAGAVTSPQHTDAVSAIS